MRLLLSSTLLSLTVLLASCSKNHYAQVEPDDLYFTRKDRRVAVDGAIVPPSPAVSTVNPTEVPTENQRSEYSNQHAPVFTSPTYANPAYGSPTIQAYGQQPYYDTSVNPDYAYEDEYTNTEGGSTEYYNEDYAYQAPPVYETPQVNNYYYGLPSGAYYPSSAGVVGINVFTSYHRPFGRPLCYWGDPFYASWDTPFYGWNNPYYGWNAYNSWYDPFNPYFGTYIGYTRIFNYGNPYYGYAGYYGGWNNFNSGDTYYSNGTKIVTQPRKSRSQVSYEVDKSNLPIKSRRADYVPSSGQESGRVATTNTNGRTTGDRSSYTRRGSSPTYYTGTDPRNGTRSSSTVQANRRNNSQRTRTVVVPTRTRTNYANRGSNGQNTNTRSYNANRSSVNRSGAVNRSSGNTTRYSTRTTNASRSSYGTRSSSGNRSNTSYRSRSSAPSRSSGTRSSYSPSRSSSPSFSAPSRSSRSSSSYSPSRSSSSRSSGGSSGRSSSGRSSSGRRN